MLVIIILVIIIANGWTIDYDSKLDVGKFTDDKKNQMWQFRAL